MLQGSAQTGKMICPRGALVEILSYKPHRLTAIQADYE